jgi:hypothetical protein
MWCRPGSGRDPAGAHDYVVGPVIVVLPADTEEWIVVAAFVRSLAWEGFPVRGLLFQHDAAPWDGKRDHLAHEASIGQDHQAIEPTSRAPSTRTTYAPGASTLLSDSKVGWICGSIVPGGFRMMRLGGLTMSHSPSPCCAHQVWISSQIGASGRDALAVEGSLDRHIRATRDCTLRMPFVTATLPPGRNL